MISLLERLTQQKQEEDSPLEHVLVFLPGWKQITDLADRVGKSFMLSKNYEVLMLHSMLPLQQQRLVFTTPTKPRIILATNIAETSITIPYVNIVVDSGYENTMSFNYFSNVDVMSLNRVTQSNVMQRRGRTGRLREGTCFHLYSFATFQEMQPFIVRPRRGADA